MVWDSLSGVDTRLNPKPQMVARDEVSADGLTLTLHLRDGLIFHDSDPVCAEDCLASVKRWPVRNAFG